MLKEDIEKILLMSFDYFKGLLGNNIDIGELKELSYWINEEMKYDLEYEQQINRNYMVAQHQLSQLMVSGRYEFKDIMGNSIILRYEDKNKTPSILESGAMIIWDKDRQDFGEKNKECSKNKNKKMSSFQAPLNYQRSKISPYNFRNTFIDFNTNIHNIDNLINLYLKLGWRKKVKPLQKIRSELIKEKTNRQIMDGKQTTLTDYTKCNSKLPK